MPQTRQARGRPPAKGGRTKGRSASRHKGRQSGRSGRGGSVVVKLPHVGARTAMRTSRRIPHRRPTLEEPEPESDTEAAEEGEEDENENENENDSLPPVAAYEEHQADMDSALEEEMGVMEMIQAEVGSSRRSRSLAARKDYINRRFLYPGEESPRQMAGRHRGRHSRESPHRSHQRRGRRPRRSQKEDKNEESIFQVHEMEEEEMDEAIEEQLSPLRIVEMDKRRRGRRRRSDTVEDEIQVVGAPGHLNKRSRRSSGRRREESDMLEVEDVGMTFPASEAMESSRRRRRGRGRPPKPRLHDDMDDDDMVEHHEILEGVSPPTGPVTGHPSPGMGDYDDEDDDDEMKAVEAVGAYDTAEFGDDEGLLSHSDESPVIVGRPGVRGGRSGFEIEDEDDFDDIEEASALVYGRPPPRSGPGLSPGGHRHQGHHPAHGHAPTSPHGGMGKKYNRRHKLGPSRRPLPIGGPGPPGSHLLEAESAGGGQGHHHLSVHGAGVHHGHHGHGHGPVPGAGVVPSGSGRESVKSEDDMDDEFMFEEGAAFTADNDTPPGGEGAATGLSHATHHGPMTGLAGHWSAGRRKTPLKPLTAGGPRSSDIEMNFLGIDDEGIMPLGAPRGEHSYSAMAQKGGPGHGGGLQDLDYYPPAAPQQYIEPPPDSHVPPPINKPTQHRHGRNSSRRPSILPRRTALPRNRQPSFSVEPAVGASSENIPAATEREGGGGQIDLPTTVITTDTESAPVTSAEVSDNDVTGVVTAATTSIAQTVSASVSETEPSPAVAASASAKLFHLRNMKRKEEQEKAAAALSTAAGGLPMESIPPEGAVLVAGIPAFRVAPGGLSILRRIPTPVSGGATQVTVSSTGSISTPTMKTVLGSANQQQAVVPATGAQLSTGAATPAGDAWLKSKNMRIVVFRNEKGEQKTVVMPEEPGVRRIVSTNSQGQIVTPGTLGQPVLVQPQQPQQPNQQQQYVTIQQPQQVNVFQPQQLQNQQQNQPIRYVKIINPGVGPQTQPIIGGVLKK